MQPRVFAVLCVAVGVISAASIMIKLADAPTIVIAAYRSRSSSAWAPFSSCANACRGA